MQGVAHDEGTNAAEGHVTYGAGHSLYVHVFKDHVFSECFAHVGAHDFAAVVNVDLSLQTQCGINYFILDSRCVLAPAPKVLGPKHISNPDFAPF